MILAPKSGVIIRKHEVWSMSVPGYIKDEIIAIAEELKAQGKYSEANELITLLKRAIIAVTSKNPIELRRTASKLKQYGAFRAARYLESIADEIKYREPRDRELEYI